MGVASTGENAVALNASDLLPKGTMPSVKGYGLRDAQFRLEQLGLKVHVRGVGRVSQQSIEPGKAISRGENVTLILGDAEDLPKAEEFVQQSDSAVTVATERPDSQAVNEHSAEKKSTPSPKSQEKEQKRHPAVEPPKRPAAVNKKQNG